MWDCKICGSAARRVLYKLPGCSVVACLGCHTVQRSPLLTGAHYEAVYQDAATLETPFYASLKSDAAPEEEPMPTYRRGLERLEQLTARGRLLDVGCSYGAFLQLARQRGWEVKGVELNNSSAEFARQKRGLAVFNGTVGQAGFPDAHFDAITLWDVIEHFDDPVGSLREISRLLAPGAVLLFFTVNQRSTLNLAGHALYRLTFNRWQHLIELFYPLVHNFFFSPETIRPLLDRVGSLELVDLQFGVANIHRWHTVPISSLMMFGTDLLDLVSRGTHRAYRMFVYARKTD